ncbi:MAG: type II toxin-antitoxin system VapC family toxin [Bryobacterales bacterium]|nr:type II toxin-antitoxin system VapC family toxin [Bryobacterales bacterium]
MVIDTSALLAVVFAESDRERFIDSLAEPGQKLLSAVNALEAAIVAEARKGPPGGRELDLLLHHARIEVVPFDGTQSEEARRVWRTFGKGNHAAALNFCDCCALALSRISGYPLLFKGQDFTRAGAASAMASPL